MSPLITRNYPLASGPSIARSRVYRRERIANDSHRVYLLNVLRIRFTHCKFKTSRLQTHPALTRVSHLRHFKWIWYFGAKMYPTSNDGLRALPPSAVNTKMRDDKVKRSQKMQILSHPHLPSASIKCVFWERNPFLSNPSLNAECIRVSDTFYIRIHISQILYDKRLRRVNVNCHLRN